MILFVHICPCSDKHVEYHIVLRALSRIELARAVSQVDCRASTEQNPDNLNTASLHSIIKRSQPPNSDLAIDESASFQ